MPFVTNVKETPEKSDYIIGFPRGLNTVQDQSLIKDKNLAQAKNVQLVVDGVSRRPGTTKPFDEGGGSKVWGLAPFYKRTSGDRELVRIANNRLQTLSADTWSDVGSTVFTSALTAFVQARNKLFIHNGTDNMRYYDGSSVTEYTDLATPSNVAVTQNGTTGSTTYGYRISAFNQVGETDASASVSITDGNADLSATDNISVTWDAVTNAEGYNVYGRSPDGLGEVYLTTVYTNSYTDDGSDAEAVTKLPSEYDNTGGVKAKGGCFSLGRQFVFGVTEGGEYQPTRIYYSGTLDYVDSFVGGDYGGGWVEVYSNDGGEIVDLEPYDDGVIIWKTNGIFKFYFTSAGLPAVEEITRSHGGVSKFGAQFVDNDYMYVGQKDNRLVVMSLGQQENYVGDALRTNDVSIFFSDQLENANRSKLDQIATWNYSNTFGFSYTTQGNTENDRGYVLDTRFGGWVYWTDDPMKATCYTVYDDETSVELYGASNSDGYVIRLWEDNRSDNGSAFKSIVGTKFYNGKMFDVDKVWRNPTLWFKYIQGGASLDVEVWSDGNKLEGSAEISTETAGAGTGSDLVGGMLAGSMTNTLEVIEEKSDLPVKLSTITIARSLGFYLIDDNVNTNWLFMGLHLRYSPLVGKPASGTQKINISA